MCTLRKAKLAMAVLLVCALCLPLSQCSRQDDSSTKSNQSKTLPQRIFPQSDDRTDYQYGIANIRFSFDGLCTVLAFGWPLIFALVGRRAAGKRFSWLLHFTELFLCAGTIYWLYALTSFGQWLYGAYVVFVIIVIYAGIVLFCLFEYLRGMFTQQSLTNQA